MAISLKGCKPDNFEPHTSLKLSFTNIWGHCSNFVECKYFLELNCHDILSLSETDLDESIDSGNFSVRSYLPLIRKDSITQMCGLAVFVNEKLCFSGDICLENSADSSFVFNWLYFTQWLTSFSYINHPLCGYAQFLILFHLT